VLTLLVTVWANPDWRRLRTALLVLWLASVAGTLLSIAMIDHPAWRWSRMLELASLVPLMALLAAGMLAFVLRQPPLTSPGTTAPRAIPRHGLAPVLVRMRSGILAA
jgi:hypothetical protein